MFQAPDNSAKLSWVYIFYKTPMYSGGNVFLFSSLISGIASLEKHQVRGYNFIFLIPGYHHRS